MHPSLFLEPVPPKKKKRSFPFGLLLHQPKEGSPPKRHPYFSGLCIVLCTDGPQAMRCRTELKGGAYGYVSNTTHTHILALFLSLALPGKRRTLGQKSVSTHFNVRCKRLLLIATFGIPDIPPPSKVLRALLRTSSKKFL